VLLIFDGGKSTKPTAAPHLPQPVIELHLRVEFKIIVMAPVDIYQNFLGITVYGLKQ